MIFNNNQSNIQIDHLVYWAKMQKKMLNYRVKCLIVCIYMKIKLENVIANEIQTLRTQKLKTNNV